MIDTDKYEGSKGRYFTGKLVDNYLNMQVEVKRLREALYKCWKDSGQSLYYLQVELLNDQEHWYQEMMCEDGSCEDCECGEKVIE